MFYGETSSALQRCADETPTAKVRLTCCACGSGHDVEPKDLIWLLKAFDMGDEQTSVSASASLDDHVCVRCGATRWEAWRIPN